MITQQQWTNIEKLLKAGFSVPQASAQTGISLPTIYRLRSRGGPKNHTRKKNNVPRQILKYKDYLDTKLKSGISNDTKLFQDLKDFQPVTLHDRVLAITLSQKMCVDSNYDPI